MGPPLNSYRLVNPLFPNLANVRGSDFATLLIGALINLLLVVGVVIFTFLLIWGAISWMSSGGDKAQIESARGRIVSALIGIVLLFSVWAIINLLEGFFGINILTLDILNLAIQ